MVTWDNYIIYFNCTLQIVINVFENKKVLISGFAKNYCYVDACLPLYIGSVFELALLDPPMLLPVTISCVMV